LGFHEFVDQASGGSEADPIPLAAGGQAQASEELLRVGDFYNELTEDFLTLRDLPPEIKDILTNRI